MECFDVLSKTRQKLNYIKYRDERLKSNEYNQGSELWILNNGKLLITKRSMKKSHPGKWETPGGCSQKSETSIDTIIREVKEEIGIFLSEENLELIGTQLYKKQFVDVFKTNETINSSNIKLQLEEVSEFRFVTKEEFIKMIKNNEIVTSVAYRYFMFKDIINIDWWLFYQSFFCGTMYILVNDNYV